MDGELRRWSPVIVAIVLIHVALRLWRLDASCLWFDEMFSVHAAEHSWPSMLTFVARDMVHPPLFYAVLKGWIAIGDESLFWLRSLPVLFSVAAILPFILLCRELALRNSATAIALFLLAVNGAMIKYAQALRMYMMLMFLALFSIWLFLRYCRRGTGIVLLTVLNIVLVYTQYFGWAVVFCELVYVLVFHRDKLRKTLISVAVTAAASAPWVIFVLSSRAAEDQLLQNIGWQAKPGIRELFIFALDLVEPVYSQVSNANPESKYMISLPLLLGAAASAVYFLTRSKTEEPVSALKVLGVFAGLTAVLTFAASWILPLSLWGTRHMIVVVALTLIFFGMAVDALKPLSLKAIGVTMMVVFAAYASVSALTRPNEMQVWCAWENKGQTVEVRPLKIVTLEGLVGYHVWFEFRNDPTVEVYRINGIDERVDESAYFIPRGFDGVKVAALEEMKDDRFMLAFRTSSRYTSVIFDRFRHAGYYPCTDKAEIFGTTNTYFVEMTKKAEMCSRP